MLVLTGLYNLPMQINTSKLLNIRSAASFLGVNPGTIRRWAQEQKLNGLKVGSRGDWRFTEEELRKLIQKNTQKRLVEVKEVLKSDPNGIQKRATKQHKKLLRSGPLLGETLEKYINKHTRIVETIANNLKDVKKGLPILKRIGKKLAKDAIEDGLTLEEAVDGTIFLRQAVWRELDEEKLLHKLTTQEFYEIGKVVGTYTDVLSSIIAFTYHDYYSKEVEKNLALREKLEKHKDEFIGIASHELKTPITTMKAYTQILQKRLIQKGDRTDQQLIKNINEQANRLTNLVDDLLNVSKLESGTVTFQKKPFDLNKLIKKVIGDMQLSNGFHRILKEGKLLEKIIGDEGRIEQVLDNLFTNAIKYSPKADKIIVRVSNSKSEALVSVQDFGVGIAKKDREKVFERFYRTNEKNEKNISGFGLGLYIASEIVKRHGGKIWVESKRGKGSTFYFTLPLYKMKS